MDTAAEEADRAKRAREDDPDAPPERGAPAPRLDDAAGPADAPAATDSMSVDGAQPQPQPELGRPGASGSEGASQTRRESAGATSAWPRREPRVGPRYQVDARWLDAARADDPAPCDDAAAAAPQSGGEGGAAADKYGHIPSLARPTPLVLVPQLGDSQTQSDEKRRAQGDFSRAGQPDRKPPERLPIALGIGANLIGRSRTTRIVDTQLSRQHMMVTLYLGAPLLLTALLIGLLVSLFQAATQINEMTLSFIPKILGVFAVLIVAGPWLLSLIIDFTRTLFQNIPFLVS